MRPLSALLCLTIFFQITQLHADSRTWVGGGGVWEDDNNWDPNEVPVIGDDAFVSGSPTVNDNIPFDNLTNDGTITVLEGALQPTGTSVANNGTINVGDGSAIISTFVLGNAATISGTGEVVLKNSDDLPGSNASIAGGTSLVNAVTNDPNHTIRGEGTISLYWVNDGTMLAGETSGDSSAVLRFDNTTVTNNGQISSASGASLEFTSTDITQNSGGTLTADTDGISIVGSNSFTGGSFASTAGGRFTQSGGITTLFGVTNDALFDLENGTVLVNTGGLTNNGTITLGDVASTGLQFRFDVAGNLDGTGEIVLANDVVSIGTTTAGQEITNGANHTIRGVGQIQSSMVNNGTIIAEPMNGGTELTFARIFATPHTNNGLIQASSGTTINFGLTSPLTQGASGILSAADGGTFELNSASVDGGTLQSTGSGKFVIQDSSSFTSVTNQAAIDVEDFEAITVLGGTLTNDGVITINSNAGPFFASATFGEDTLIDGSGEVFLNGFTNNAQSQILPGGLTITQGPNHAVRGYGQIIGPGKFVNNGSIEGDSTANPVRIRSRLEGTGTLKNVLVDRGTFSDQIGVHAPGNGVGTVDLEGTYTIFGNNPAQARLEIEIGGLTAGTEHDLLDSTGDPNATITLAGNLDVLAVDLGNSYVPTAGDRFTILQSSNPITGTFFSANFPDILGSREVTWLPVDYTTDPNAVTLEIATVDFFDADFDEDGDVDNDDLTNWQAGYGTLGAGHTDGDANGDGLVTGADFLIWQQQFGLGVSSLVTTALPVPEPGCFSSFLTVLSCVLLRRSRRQSS